MYDIDLLSDDRELVEFDINLRSTASKPGSSELTRARRLIVDDRDTMAGDLGSTRRPLGVSTDATSSSYNSMDEAHEQPSEGNMYIRTSLPFRRLSVLSFVVKLYSR